MKRSRSLHPLIALVAVALVPAMLLTISWRAAGAAADRHRLARAALGELIDPAHPTVVAAPTSEGSTAMLSWRRNAQAMAQQLNFTTFSEQVARVSGLVNDRSCLSVSVNGQPAGGRSGDLVVIPASVIKIVIAAVALENLGEDFVFSTLVEGRLDPDGVVRGGLRIVGGGDPLLSGEWYPTSGLERNPVFHHTSLDRLADDLVALGVTKIEGEVVGVADRHDSEFFVPGWGRGVAGVEAGPISALIANDSRVRGDPLRSSDPALGAAREFVRLLAERNVPVLGSAISDYTGEVALDPEAVELVRIDSAPLGAVIEEMLTNSDNNTAEMLLKEIGLQASGSGTRAAGRAAVLERLGSWGIDTSALVIDDGSGLSLENRLTCDVVQTILNRFGVQSAIGQGLALAGRTGTLSQIFTEGPMEGLLRAKTGTLNNPPFDRDPPAVKGLAGYLPIGDLGSVEFTMILNGPTISDQREYRPLWDALVQVLATYPSVVELSALGPK